MAEQKIHAFVEANAPRFLDELKAFVSIPSISALPAHTDDVRRAAEWLQTHIAETTGLATELIETPGHHPIVYGERLDAPGKPTVLIYGHYDVQPVDPVELWETPPFEPTVKGDNLYARGAVDDKGPTFATIKALETLRAVRGSLPVNVKVLIEGEEESGGEAIEAYVKGHAERLKADCVLILDTGSNSVDVPELTYGLRGLTYFELVANGAGGDLHSGSYGGIAPNPIQALCWALAELKGPDGRINIPGLYELMEPVDADERATFERQSAREEQVLMDAAGLTVLPGEAGYSIIERATARPTFEVHGIRGGFVGDGAKTVIPATALAKVSLRLVAGQEPGAVLDLVRQRLNDFAYPGITFDVRDLHGGNGVTFPRDAKALQVAAAALEDEYGAKAEFVRTGGSIPIAALFHSVLGLPGVMMGFGLPDDNVHAPNEKFYIPNFYRAIRSVADFLERLPEA